MRKTVHAMLICLLALMVTVVSSVPASVFAAGAMNKPTANDVVYYKDSNDQPTGIKSIAISPYTYYNISRDPDINPEGTTIELDDMTLEKIVKQQIFPRWGIIAEGIFRDQANQLVTIEGSGLMSSSKTDDNSFDRQFSYKRPGVSDSYKEYNWSLEDLAKSLGTPDPKNIHLDAELPEFKRLRGSTNDDEIVYSGIYGINNLSEARTLMGKSLRACADDDDLTVDDFLGNGYDKTDNKYRLPDLDKTDTRDGYCSIVTCVNRAGASGDYDYVSFGVAVYDFDVTPIAANELGYIHSAQEYMDSDDPIEAAAAAHVNGVTFESTSPPDTISYLTNKTPQESASAVSTEFEESEEIGSTTEESFEWGMEQEVGTEISIGDRDKSFARATIHFNYTFHELWNTMKGTSESRAKATRRTVSQEISLPGHTAARIVQRNSTSTGKENYQQPVVLNYKVAIFAMSGDYYNGWGGMISNSRYDKEWMSVIFDGSDSADMNGCRALSSLYNRAVINKDTDGYDRTKGKYKSWSDKSDFKYSTKINWGSVASALADDTRDSHKILNHSGNKSTLQDLASELLFAETARAFVRDRKVSESTVESLVPIYNLKSVDITKGSRNYEMRTGNKFYLDSIELDGFDRDDVAFYGFDPSWGIWELSDTDASGAETTEENGVTKVTTSDGFFTLATDNETGSQWTEIRSEQTTDEKTYRLDWKIDTGSKVSSLETLNDIEGHPTGCMKAEELAAVKTPTIGFSVKSDTADVKAITISGAYEGPYDQTVNLNKELDVSVMDSNDHMMSIPIYWEDNDVHTIDVHESGETKFSTPGTYKVRAFSWNNGHKITSNWITITAKEKAALSRIGFSAEGLDENDLALTKKNQSRSYDLNSFLSFYDQFDNVWEGTEEDPLPTISFTLESGNEDSAEIDESGILTVSEPGTYRIAAKAKDQDGRVLNYTIPKVKLVITADRWLDSIEFDSPAMGQSDLRLREKGDQIKISNLKSLLSYYDQKGAVWTGDTPRASFRVIASADGAEIKSGDGYTFFAYKPGVYTIQPVVSGYEVNSVTLEVTEDPYLVIKTNDPVKQYITEPDEPVVLDLDKYVNATTQFDGTWKDTPAMRFTLDEGVTGASIEEKTITVPDPETGSDESIHIENAFVCDTPGVYTVHVAVKKASAYSGTIDDIEVTVAKKRKVRVVGLNFRDMNVDDKVLSDSWTLDPADYLEYEDQFGDAIDKKDYGDFELPEITGYTIISDFTHFNGAEVHQNDDGTFYITAANTGSCGVIPVTSADYECSSGYLDVIDGEAAQAIKSAKATLNAYYIDLCQPDKTAEEIFYQGYDSLNACMYPEEVQEVLDEIINNLSVYAHEWDTVTYTWADDDSSVTASRTCTRDGSHKQEETVATTSEVTTEPTETEAGILTITAEFTNEAFATQTKTEAIPVHKHTLSESEENEVAATCTENGSYDKVEKCTECGNEISRTHVETEALGHEWDDGTESTTEDDVTIITYKCKRSGCDAERVVSTSAGDTPSMSYVEEQPATCTTTGFKAHYVSSYGQLYLPSESTEGAYDEVSYEDLVIKAKHTPGETVKENVKENGYDEVVYCSVCNTELSRSHKTISKPSLANAGVEVAEATYTGKELQPAVTVTLDGKTLTKDTDYTLAYSNNINAGTATVSVTGKGKYTGTVSKDFTIAKAAQPMTVKAVNKTFKYKKLKKKAKSYKAISVANKQGAVSYKVTYKNDKSKKALKFKNGKVKVKKKTKRGTYKITVKVTTKGNANYKGATITKTVTVKVK